MRSEILLLWPQPGTARPSTNASSAVNLGTGQISLNSQQAMAKINGTYMFVVSLTDPGVYNWLDTSGLREGTFMLFQLISVLPSETRYVTPEERKEQLGERATGYALRVWFGYLSMLDTHRWHDEEHIPIL
ncbi:hypothetical protein OIDMADRAFT_29499 [Oidiodendron maius Zn]|uniref:DUF1214 domain-containing protein n=1 Tax=Oidiodendron maius (strain Zn) TaxID=913774 RepID=A0A0C3CMZ4_OIDMZ|nr:hypothetical protein OIDMADRAFT_29499 [Oidiodendron maius Zn]